MINIAIYWCESIVTLIILANFKRTNILSIEHNVTHTFACMIFNRLIFTHAIIGNITTGNWND